MDDIREYEANSDTEADRSDALLGEDEQKAGFESYRLLICNDAAQLDEDAGLEDAQDQLARALTIDVGNRHRDPPPDGPVARVAALIAQDDAGELRRLGEIGDKYGIKAVVRRFRQDARDTGEAQEAVEQEASALRMGRTESRSAPPPPHPHDVLWMWRGVAFGARCSRPPILGCVCV